jgi:hypothetical protein
MKLSGRFLNPPFSPGNVSRTGATKVTPRVSGGTSRPATPIARRARFRRREKVEDVVVDDTFDHVERTKWISIETANILDLSRDMAMGTTLLTRNLLADGVHKSRPPSKAA